MAKVYVKSDNLGDNATHLKIEIYHCKGGINYSTYKQDPQGICVRVLPVKIEESEHFISESFGGFSGQSYLLEELTRKSAKKLAHWDSVVLPMKDNIIETFLASGFAGVRELFVELVR